jgi:hypothetical protein
VAGNDSVAMAVEQALSRRCCSFERHVDLPVTTP